MENEDELDENELLRGSQEPLSLVPFAPPTCQVLLCVLLNQVAFPSSKSAFNGAAKAYIDPCDIPPVM